MKKWIAALFVSALVGGVLIGCSQPEGDTGAGEVKSTAGAGGEDKTGTMENKIDAPVGGAEGTPGGAAPTGDAGATPPAGDGGAPAPGGSAPTGATGAAPTGGNDTAPAGDAAPKGDAAPAGDPTGAKGAPGGGATDSQGGGH